MTTFSYEIHLKKLNIKHETQRKPKFIFFVQQTYKKFFCAKKEKMMIFMFQKRNFVKWKSSASHINLYEKEKLQERRKKDFIVSDCDITSSSLLLLPTSFKKAETEYLN